MSYKRWIGNKWSDFVDWLLIRFGWNMQTLHNMHVAETSYFEQGDIYRVANVEDKFIILYVIPGDILICAKVNALGAFILFCRNIKSYIRNWRRNLNSK